MNVNITCDKTFFSLHVQSVLYKNDEDLKIIWKDSYFFCMYVSLFVLDFLSLECVSLIWRRHQYL